MKKFIPNDKKTHTFEIMLIGKNIEKFGMVVAQWNR